MHFVAMLALRLPIQIVYDLPLTILSCAFSVLASGLALFTLRRLRSGARDILVPGFLIGLGIAAMHYTGMAAMKMIGDPLRSFVVCALGRRRDCRGHCRAMDRLSRGQPPPASRHSPVRRRADHGRSDFRHAFHRDGRDEFRPSIDVPCQRLRIDKLDGLHDPGVQRSALGWHNAAVAVRCPSFLDHRALRRAAAAGEPGARATCRRAHTDPSARGGTQGCHSAGCAGLHRLDGYPGTHRRVQPGGGSHVRLYARRGHRPHPRRHHHPRTIP